MKQGIIIENISNIFKIICENELYTCDARGKLKKDDMTYHLVIIVFVS